MKFKFSYILLLSAVMGAAMVGCDDNDEVLKDALQAPNTNLDQKSYNSLSFSWEKVPNAIQYGYVLTNPSGKVIGENTTVETSASFSGLLPNTEYTLNVWAFPSLQSDYSSSPSFTLVGTTDPLKKVDAPQPVAVQVGTKVTVSWDAIDVASSYTYTLTGPGIDEPEAKETTDTEVSYFGLDLGVYEFSIYANCTTGGYETASAVTTITFEYDPPKDWRARGTLTYFYYNDGTQFQTVLSYNYDNDSYSLESWCGVDGYNFDFKVSENGMELVGLELGSNGYYQVPTGLENPSYLNVYPDPDYSTFEGDMNEGQIWICFYNPDWTIWDYIGFIWDAETSHPTIDDICGSYLYWDWGYEYYTKWGTWNEFNYEAQPCTITKLDDTSVWISTLLSYPGFEECGFTASYNAQTLTLSVPVQSFADYYTLGLDNDDYSSGTGPEQGIEAKMAGDGSISMENWVVYYYYNSWWYKYFTYTGSYWAPESADAQAKAAKARALMSK